MITKDEKEYLRQVGKMFKPNRGASNQDLVRYRRISIMIDIHCGNLLARSKK